MIFFSDLIAKDITPVFPYLHYLFSFLFLHIDSKTAFLTELMQTILKNLQFIFTEGIFELQTNPDYKSATHVYVLQCLDPPGGTPCADQISLESALPQTNLEPLFPLRPGCAKAKARSSLASRVPLCVSPRGLTSTNATSLHG